MGIFQREPIMFPLSLTPLTKFLRKVTPGYKFSSDKKGRPMCSIYISDFHGIQLGRWNGILL